MLLQNPLKYGFSRIEVTNNYNRTASVTEMLHQLQWDSLEARRNNLRVISLYKIINKLVDIFREEHAVIAYKQCYKRPLPKISTAPNKN